MIAVENLKPIHVYQDNRINTDFNKNNFKVHSTFIPLSDSLIHCLTHPQHGLHHRGGLPSYELLSPVWTGAVHMQGTKEHL